MLVIFREIGALLLYLFILVFCCVPHSAAPDVIPPGAYACKSEIDSVTRLKVYTTADIMPVNEGGPSALMRKLTKNVQVTSAPEDYDSRVIVAFIVNPDGTIMGERVIQDQTSKVGKQMIAIVKEFKWHPGICNNKKVPVLHQLPLQICLSND